MTTEQLTQKLKVVESNLDKINYHGIHQIFLRNGWTWGGLDEPEYTPEYRDIRRHVRHLFKSLSAEILKADMDNYDYDTQHATISGGRIRASLFWESASEDPELIFELELLSDLATVQGETYNYIDDCGFDVDSDDE